MFLQILGFNLNNSVNTLIFQINSMFLLIFANIADIFSTFLGLFAGASEINPFLQYFGSIEWFLLFNLILMVFMWYFMFSFFSFSIWFNSFIFIMYSFVVINNVFQFFNYSLI